MPPKTKKPTFSGMSLPKQHLFRFLTATENDAKYTFFLDANNEANAKPIADAFIHRMRVELSRLRSLMRERYNRAPIPFKMLVDSIEYMESENKVQITLTKSEQGVGRIMANLDNIFNSMDGGPLL